MMTMIRTDQNPVVWTITLATAAVLGTLATACMMPFVALATIAAGTMPRNQAIIAVLGAWVANQLLGFGLLGYPATGYAIAWGIALGVASLAVIPLVRRLSNGSVARLLLAFTAAFVACEAVLFGYALAVGGTGTFTPAILLRLFGNEALWFAILGGLHLILTHSAPRVFGRSPLVRLG
jgi:hypothetical protein